MPPPPPPPPRQRTAQKRPLLSDDLDDSGSDASCSSSSGWQPSTGTSQAESTEATNSASEETTQGHVIAPPPRKMQFKSWEAFDAHLAVYQAQSFQIFRARTNTTVLERNDRMEKKKSKALRLPVEWEQYARMFVCTHHGSYRSQATTKRPRQETRARGCKAQINACVQVVDKVNKTFAVRITKCKLQHNHALTEYGFKSHPSNRISLDEGGLKTVDELRKAGAKKISILKFIKDNSSSNPKAQDVQNLVRKLKAGENQQGRSSSAKRLKKWMTDFGEIPGNVGRIFVDDVDGKRVATCITLQTKHMRNLFTQFPEVLLIDATHGTNRSKYKVFSFMAHDTFGKGQFVQHALLQNERWPTLLTALEEFKANNPSWTKLQCVLIDKDFTEMSVLKQAFPDVTILLCQFHVLKYLREEIASSDYGFNSWQKDQLRGVMSLLVYAKTEMEYARHFEYMQHLASVGYTAPVQTTPTESSTPVDDELASVGHENHPVGHQMGQVGHQMGPVGYEMGTVGQDLSSTSVVGDERRSMHPFVAYFIKNWDNCRELWCAYKRQNTVTLGNNTNNRLEASWKQLKEWVDSFMAVDECIASIMYYQSLQERRFIDEVYKNVNVQNVGYDHEMSLVANLVSAHACELIRSQYLYALGPAAYDVYEGYPDVYFVKSTRRDDDALDEPDVKYSVTKRDWICSCLFMSTRLLPCRHVFFLRRTLGKETVIPTQLLNRRWLISSVRSAIEFQSTNDNSSPLESFAIRRVLSTTEDRPWDSNRKYREAFPIASEICDSVAGLGMAQYREAMEYLKKVARCVKNRDFKSPAALELLTNDAGRADSGESGTQSGTEIVDRADNSVSMDSDDTAEGPVDYPLADHLPQVDTADVEQSRPGVAGFQSGTELGESGIQSGSGLGESGITHEVESTIELPVVPATLELARDGAFEVASPQKSRGRPKQTARAKKSARNKIVSMAQEDSDMFASNLSLVNVQDSVNNQPTYDSAAALLGRFKLFDFGKKPRAPIAHKVSSLPPVKQVTPIGSITRIFRSDVIDRCTKKVSSLQKQQKDAGRTNLAQKDVVVEIIGVGLYSTETLTVMQKWHRAMKSIQHVDKAVKWIDTIDFNMQMPDRFKVERDPYILHKLKEIPLLSVQAEALELVGKSALGDDTVNTLMLKMFAANVNTVVVDTSVAGNVMNGFMPVESMQKIFTGVTKEKILIPVICGKNHWCSIMMDLMMKDVCVYDPMNSSYGVNLRPIADKLAMMVPDAAPRRYRVRAYHSDLGVQVDSYNCGVYMLLAFELFAGAESISQLSRKELQYLRYRYLCMCLN